MNEGNKDRQLHRVPRGHQSGLPTRLLDWTDNPLVACFFAVDENSEDDGVIYAYHNESYIPVDRHPDPFQYQKRLIQGWNSLDFMKTKSVSRSKARS
jgi:hypothetical protein